MKYNYYQIFTKGKNKGLVVVLSSLDAFVELVNSYHSRGLHFFTYFSSDGVRYVCSDCELISEEV